MLTQRRLRLARRRRLLLEDSAEEATPAPLYDIDAYSENRAKNLLGTDLSAMAIDSSGTYLYLLEDSGGIPIKSATLSIPWDIMSATLTGDTLAIGTGFRARGMWVSDDGVYLFCTPSSSIVRRYTMSTAWDLSTAGSMQSYDFSSTVNAGQSIIFNDDGTRFWFMANNGLEVNEYALSTAWDLSSAGDVVATVDLSNECTEPRACFFDEEGYRLYLADSTDKTIYQYNLATAFDVGTASYASKSLSISGQQAGSSTVYDARMKPGNNSFLMVVNATVDEVIEMLSPTDPSVEALDDIAITKSSAAPFTGEASMTFYGGSIANQGRVITSGDEETEINEAWLSDGSAVDDIWGVLSVDSGTLSSSSTQDTRLNMRSNNIAANLTVPAGTTVVTGTVKFYDAETDGNLLGTINWTMTAIFTG